MIMLMKKRMHQRMDCLHFEKWVRDTYQEVTCHLKRIVVLFASICLSMYQMLRLVCCSYSEIMKNKLSLLKKLASINLIGRKGSAFKYC